MCFLSHITPAHAHTAALASANSLLRSTWDTFAYGKVRQFQTDFQTILEHHEVQVQENVAIPQPMEGFSCDRCQPVFTSFKALCSHTYQQHGEGNIAHKYADGNTCRACLKTYDSRVQLVHHLKYYRTGCLVKLICTVSPMTEEECQQAADVSRQQQPLTKHKVRRTRHKYPVIQSHGPRRLWPWMRAIKWSGAHHSPPEMNDIDKLQWTQSVLTACETGDETQVLEHLQLW